MADVVRHPSLTLDLFTTEMLEDSDEAEDNEPDDDAIGQVLDLSAFLAARRRRAR